MSEAPRPSAWDVYGRVLAALVVCISPALLACGVWIWQIVDYLRDGTWPALSVIDALRWAEVQWARSPDDWFGVYELLSKTPTSVALIIVAAIGMFVIAAAD